MKKMLKTIMLVAVMLLSNTMFAEITVLDHRELGFSYFNGLRVLKMVVCDTREEVLSLPLIKDRQLAFDEYLVEKKNSTPVEKDSWMIFYLELENSMVAFISNHRTTGVMYIYTIYMEDTM